MRWIIVWAGLIVGVGYLFLQSSQWGGAPSGTASQSDSGFGPSAEGEEPETLPVLGSASVPAPGSRVEVELAEEPALDYAKPVMTESDHAYKSVVDQVGRNDVVYDANLGSAARELAIQHSLLGGLVPQHIVDFLLRSAGAIDRSVVQAYTATGGEGLEAVETRLRSLLASQAQGTPVTRVGIGEAYIPGAKRSRHIAILMSFRQVEVASTPRAVSQGARWTLTGVLPPDYRGASTLILRPSGVLETMPLTTQGRRFALTLDVGDEVGTLHVSVGAEGPHGHTPLVQLPIEVGRSVPRTLVSVLLPDEGGIHESHEAEALAMSLLNADRERYDLPPLVRDTALDQVSRLHSVDMRDHQFFGHYSQESGSPSDRLSSTGYRTAQSAENVAKGPSIHGAQAGLMRSLGHRRNILNKSVTHVGIGVAGERQEKKTVWWLTQVFALPVERVTSTSGRDRVLGRIQSQREAAGHEPLERDEGLADVAAQGVLELAAGGGQGVPDRLLNDASRRFPRKERLFVWAASTTDLDTLTLPAHLFQSTTRWLGLAVHQYPDHPHGLIGIVIMTANEGSIP